MVLKSIYEKIIGATCSSKSSVETIDNSQVPASLKVGSGEMGGQLLCGKLLTVAR